MMYTYYRLYDPFFKGYLKSFKIDNSPIQFLDSQGTIDDCLELDSLDKIEALYILGLSSRFQIEEFQIDNSMVYY